ncbi:MAG: DUF4003 family protein, partial [Bacillota bacterium]|nr:DUF4003 family protein [Bacillota bacterium]
MVNMDNNIKKNCRLLIDNRTVIKKAARWDMSLNQWLAALLCTMEGVKVKQEKLISAKSLVKENVGITSRFRGTFSLPVAALLAVSPYGSSLLKKAMTLEDALRSEGFKRSNYTVLPSILLMKNGSAGNTAGLARSSREFYDVMKRGHKLSVGQKDYGIAMMLAASGLKPEETSTEAQRCFDYLSSSPFKKRSLVALCYILAMGEKRAEIKCQKALDIYEALKLRGLKFGTGYEAPTLGVVSLYPDEAGKIAADIGDIAEYLLAQRGFGIFGVSKAQTLMFAGALLALSQNYDANDKSVPMAVTAGSTALIMAVEAAIAASIGASAAAASAASSNSN